MSKEGPSSDVDKPLEKHIEEMLIRALIVISVGLAAILVMFPISENIIQILWDAHIPNPDQNAPRLYSPLSVVMTRIKIMILVALVVSFPVLIYQAYQFMQPGLYDIEKMYFKLCSGISLVLSLLGILITHFILVPLLFFYFSSYTEGVAEIAFGLQNTVGLMLIIMIYIVIVFQMPIFLILAVITNVTSYEWIERRRLLFWGAFFGIAFLSSPDPTGMAPVIIGVIMLVLFELTLIILRYLPSSDRGQK